MTPAPPERPEISVLPRGWARFLLVAVALLVVVAWLVGKEAAPPDFDRASPPSRIRAVPPPAPVPD